MPDGPVADGRAAVLLLPDLCCEAVGGERSASRPVTAAWQLFYAAAHLLDKVADGDIPPGEKVGMVSNVATGLLVSAGNALATVSQAVGSHAAYEIQHRFYECLLKMCTGQHSALTQSQPTLEQCWEMVAMRSGVFFALGCRAGAQVVTDDPVQLDSLEAFGLELGTLIQIGNDVSGLWSQDLVPSDLRRGERRTLPMVYALEVMPLSERARLLECLKAAPTNEDAEIGARQLIIESGALLYLSVEAERRRRRAEKALTDSACVTQEKLLAVLAQVAEVKAG